MKQNTKVTEFVSFCIEEYKIYLGGASGTRIANYFNECGVIDFLIEYYDELHSLGKAQILEEIETYIKNRGAQ